MNDQQRSNDASSAQPMQRARRGRQSTALDSTLQQDGDNGNRGNGHTRRAS